MKKPEDYNKYADIDEDEILKTLTEEQLEELAYELDPDVSSLTFIKLP